MLGTILFALLWFVLGVVATIVGFFAFIAWCDRRGAFNNWNAEETRENAESIIKFARTLFSKK